MRQSASTNKSAHIPMSNVGSEKHNDVCHLDTDGRDFPVPLIIPVSVTLVGCKSNGSSNAVHPFSSFMYLYMYEVADIDQSFTKVWHVFPD